MLFFYNNAKKSVDLSDQITLYRSCFWKTVKQNKQKNYYTINYTNAWYIHQRWDNKYINILQFRRKVIDHLLTNNHNIGEMAIEKRIPSKKDSHILHSHNGSGKKASKGCEEYYKCLYKKKGRDYATKKGKRVTMYCNRCEGQLALCLKCFQKLDRNT